MSLSYSQKSCAVNLREPSPGRRKSQRGRGGSGCRERILGEIEAEQASEVAPLRRNVGAAEGVGRS
ncbi:hypothetical protein L7F22_001872, partial [Adiantum nelumboides]|nr:hypothetical protein [Adiantum nelumboides]